MTARTNRQTLDAVELVKQGVSTKEAAKKCGVHRSTIWRALRREKLSSSNRQMEAGESTASTQQ